MVELEMDFEKDMARGKFPDEKEETGSFEEEKHPDYFWKLSVKKTEIPPPPLPEGGADIMGKVFTMVSEQLSKSTRQVKLTVSWKEFDDDEEEVGLVLTTHIVKM